MRTFVTPEGSVSPARAPVPAVARRDALYARWRRIEPPVPGQSAGVEDGNPSAGHEPQPAFPIRGSTIAGKHIRCSRDPVRRRENGVAQSIRTIVQRALELVRLDSKKAEERQSKPEVPRVVARNLQHARDRDIPGGGVATLCFDEETGLLLRMVRYTDSPVGRLVTRIDYREYREVAGVKLPVRWTQRWLSGRSQFELTELQPNTAIPSERFSRPVILERP